MSGWKPSPDTPEWLVQDRHPAVLNPMKIKPTGDRCYYCGLELVTCGKLESGQTQPDNLKTFDHKIPVIRGGKNGSNLVICCYGCNIDKGNLTVEEYRLVLAYREGIIRDASHVYKFWREQNPK